MIDTAASSFCFTQPFATERKHFLCNSENLPSTQLGHSATDVRTWTCTWSDQKGSLHAGHTARIFTYSLIWRLIWLRLRVSQAQMDTPRYWGVNRIMEPGAALVPILHCAVCEQGRVPVPAERGALIPFLCLRTLLAVTPPNLCCKKWIVPRKRKVI